VLPYSWEDAGTSLPPRLTLDPDAGLLTGMPTVADTHMFRVQVTDYSGPSFTFVTFDRQLVIGP